MTGHLNKTTPQKYIPNTQTNFSKLIGENISISCTGTDNNKWEGNLVIGIPYEDSRFTFYKKAITNNIYRLLAKYYGESSE